MNETNLNIRPADSVTSGFLDEGLRRRAVCVRRNLPSHPLWRWLSRALSLGATGDCLRYDCTHFMTFSDLKNLAQLSKRQLTSNLGETRPISPISALFEVDRFCRTLSRRNDISTASVSGASVALEPMNTVPAHRYLHSFIYSWPI